VVTGAEGGTSAAEWAKGLALYDNLLARCNSVGGVTLNIMQQGERDATLGTLNTAYEAQTNQNINDVFTDLGVQTFIVPLQTITAAGYDGNGTTTGQVAIRASQINVASSNANVYGIGVATTGIDISIGAPDDLGNNDGLHFKTDGTVEELAQSMYLSLSGSILNITFLNSEVPNGTYDVDFYNDTTKLLLETRSIVFSDSTLSESLPVVATTPIFGKVDGGNMPTNGAPFYGLTV
jgi:hypothetical protein